MQSLLRQKNIIKKEIEYDLKNALLDFTILKKTNSLPYKMQIKLQYLQNKLLNLPLASNQLKQLPDYQINSLEQCDEESKKKLFISIVKCLIGKELIVYFQNEQIYFKKQESFTIWHNYYIACDSEKIWIKKKSQYRTIYKQFKIKQTKISKKCVQYKNKLCFGLMTIDKDKYMIGFKHESACHRIFKMLKHLMKQNQVRNINIKNQTTLNNKKNVQKMTGKIIKKQLQIQKLNYVQNSLHNINQKQSYRLQKRQRKNSESLLIYQGQIEFEQNQAQDTQIIFEKFKLQQREQLQQNLIKEQIKKQQFTSGFDNNFKLLKNFQLGRILINENDYKIKLTALFNHIQTGYDRILQMYMQMKNWNLEVEECQIINRISRNSYKLFVKFKRYSFVSMPRWVFLNVTAIQIDRKAYLLIRNFQDLTQEQMLKSTVSAVQIKSFHQTIELCKRNENDDRILMTILTKADFGGYCTKTDNINMTIHSLGNICNFYNFIQAENISKQNEGANKLFDFNKIKKQQYHSSNSSIRQKSQSNQKTENIFERQSSMLSSDCEDQEQLQKSYKINLISDFSIKKQLKYEQSQAIPQLKQTYDKSSSTYTQFLDLFSLYQSTSLPSDRLVQLIGQKLTQKYYLKHHFQLQSIYQQQSKHHNNDKYDNWLTQKNKWKIQKQQLIFIDQQILNRHKNVLKFILKQISTNVMAGKSIMNMSLPVEIFQEKSFLEKCAQAFGFLPAYLIKAAEQTNINKQVQYVSIAMAFSMSVCPNIQKPFNPILGETYQCKIGGLNVYFQQISHHPPISAFYIKTQLFEFNGSFNPNVEMGLNTVQAKNEAPFHIRFFKTKTKYIGYSQDFQISGLMFGDRKMRSAGKALVFEQINQILCELSFGKMKKGVYDNKKIRPGQMIGGIYKVSNGFSKRFKSVSNIRQFDGLKNDEKIQELAKFRGNWLGDCYVNEIQVKDIQNPIPFKPVKLCYVLPSDCSYRLDSYYKRLNDLKKAQQWKQIMQNQQRKDRRLRQQYNKSGH